jgi:hypothetical protein
MAIAPSPFACSKVGLNQVDSDFYEIKSKCEHLCSVASETLYNFLIGAHSRDSHQSNHNNKTTVMACNNLCLSKSAFNSNHLNQNPADHVYVEYRLFRGADDRLRPLISGLSHHSFVDLKLVYWIQVGIKLADAMIEDMVFGGPAYNSTLLDRGDIISKVDNIAMSSSEIQQALSGNGIPWSTVSLTVQKPCGRSVEVNLFRMPSSIVANRCKLLTLLSACKVHSSKCHFVGVICDF